MTSMPPLYATAYTLDSTPVAADALGVIPDSDQALTAELTRLAGHINAAHYRFLKLLAALIQRRAWGGDSGMKTPAHWLNYYCGIDLGAAREKVRVAMALPSLPQIDRAFASGAISYSKVRAMTRSATPGNESVLLNVARHGTAQHVEKLVRLQQRVQRLNRAAGNPQQGQHEHEHDTHLQTQEQYQPQSQHQARELSWFYDEDGMLEIRGRFAPEDGAVVVKALEAALDSIVKDRAQKRAEGGAQNRAQDRAQAKEQAPDVSAETSPAPDSASTFPRKRAAGPAAFPLSNANSQSARDVSAETSPPTDADATFPQKRADALLLMAEHFLATLRQGPQQEPRHLASADKYQVLVHLDARSDSVSSLFGQSACLDDGPPLPDATCKRLACDASMVPVLRDDSGNVLNIGRKSRVVPPAMRRALKIRDGGCRHPGCTQTRHVDAHHIEHWCDGGETSLDNLVLLCRYHHRLLHENAFSIARGADGRGAVRFLDGQGREIKTSLWPQFAGPFIARDGRIGVEVESERFGLGIDAGTAITRWQGERMDYRMAIDALCGS